MLFCIFLNGKSGSCPFPERRSYEIDKSTFLPSCPFDAACSDTTDGNVSQSSKVKDVDVSGYALIYGNSQGASEYTATFRTQMEGFANKLTAATGEKFTAYSMSRAKTTPKDKEILVGLTTREESKSAVSKIEGEGFVIEVTDNKIVIAGSSNLFTLMAVNYFVEKSVVYRAFWK